MFSNEHSPVVKRSPYRNDANQSNTTRMFIGTSPNRTHRSRKFSLTSMVWSSRDLPIEMMEDRVTVQACSSGDLPREVENFL